VFRHGGLLHFGSSCVVHPGLASGAVPTVLPPMRLETFSQPSTGHHVSSVFPLRRAFCIARLKSGMLRVAASLAVGVAFGCASTPTPGRAPDPPVSREPERVPAAPPTTRPPSTFSYRDGSYAYDFRQTTTVSVGTEVGPVVEDTLQTVAGLTYAFSTGPGTPPLASVTIDSLVIASVRDTMAPVRRLAAPVTAQLPLVSLPMTTTADSTALLATCDALDDAARALASDLYVRIPVVVERGQSWTDSTAIAMCRGGIPMTGTRISRFQVTDVRTSRDSAVAKISRQSSLTLAGVGTQGTRRITVRGEGSSETLLTYDLAAGRFLESTGQSVLQLGFETIQQTDRVVQRSSSTVRLRVATPAGNIPPGERD
jgi:hypothetical protein